MHVAEQQHVDELLLLVAGEALRLVDAAGVLVGAEQHVPDREVAVVALVTVALVVDAVHLRALEQVAEDVRGAQVRVVEHLAERGEHDVVGAGLDADAHHHVGDEAAQQRVEDHLGRMLVEGGEYLDALRRVVQLVEQPPERVVGVARAMPPVGDEGVDEVGGEAGQQWWQGIRGVQQAVPHHPFVPGDAGEQGDRHLDDVEEDHPGHPGAHLGQFPAGNQLFQHEDE